MSELHVRELGAGEPVLFVHGSVFDGGLAWRHQLELADRFKLIIPDRRGYGQSPDRELEDFEVDARDMAELLDGGAHLVGLSYGAVVSLLAAALRPDAVRSLTVIEPPAYDVVRGDPRAEEALASERQFMADFATASPEEVLEQFLPTLGDDPPARPMPASLLRGARMLVHRRPPWEARIPLAELARARFPKLVVSGGHSPSFDAISDTLERELGAERAVIVGAGHRCQWTGKPFNDRLVTFIAGATPRESEPPPG